MSFSTTLFQYNAPTPTNTPEPQQKLMNNNPPIISHLIKSNTKWAMEHKKQSFVYQPRSSSQQLVRMADVLENMSTLYLQERARRIQYQHRIEKMQDEMKNLEADFAVTRAALRDAQKVDDLEMFFNKNEKEDLWAGDVFANAGTNPDSNCEEVGENVSNGYNGYTSNGYMQQEPGTCFYDTYGHQPLQELRNDPAGEHLCTINERPSYPC